MLTTKLTFPPLRTQLVPRTRLVGQLHEGLKRPLTLISAPAGYGKTTLLSEWHSKSGREFPAAWLSLDEGDNDLQSFINYLVLAIESAGTGLAGKTLLVLQSPTRPATALILNSLMDDLIGYPNDIAIILDDYHIIESSQVHDALKFLLEHLPSQIHLILLTRADPPLPLSRLRVRGQLSEIRTADLRFTFEETSAFLNDCMGLNLSAGDIAALEARTEGWIAGLQLAALSMQGRGDLRNFINAFTGSHRYIVDYLAEEVLSRQPGHVQDFLLQTSILEQMNASLCKALLRDNQNIDSQTVLEYLERANIFLTPLDDERQWYRYHHLFADFLRNRLQHSMPELLPELYQRAIRWYEQNDLIDQAIQHALNLKNFEYATELLQDHWLHLLQQGHVRAKLITWVEELPETIIATNPQVCMVQAIMLLSSGRIADAKRYVAFVEKTLETQSTDPEHQSLQAEVLVFKACDAVENQDFAGALEFARRAQAIAPVSALFTREIIASALTNIHLELGNFVEALQAAQEDMALARAGGAPAGRVSAVYSTAKIYQLEGQLHLSMDVCKEAMQIAEAENQARYPQFGMIYQHMASILQEWNQLPQAERYANIAVQMAEQSGDLQQRIGVQLQLLHLRFAQGNFSAASDLLNDLLLLFQQSSDLAAMHVLHADLARWQALLGQPEKAQVWLDRIDLTVCSPIGMSRGTMLLDAARVLLALHQASQALDLLSRLETSFDRCLYWKIECLVLQTMAWHQKGEHSRALSCLGKALGLAERSGFVRIFLDETPVIIDLLRRAATQGMHLRYTTRLLDSIPTRTVRPVPSPVAQGLLEPLSDREQEVLNLIARGRLNKEIADELIIAIGTVKRHTANIFRKLDVINRTQAVARSRELGLL